MTKVVTPLQNLVEGTASRQAGKSFSGQRLIKLNFARGVFSKIRVGICVDVSKVYTYCSAVDVDNAACHFNSTRSLLSPNSRK